MKVFVSIDCRFFERAAIPLWITKYTIFILNCWLWHSRMPSISGKKTQIFDQCLKIGKFWLYQASSIPLDSVPTRWTTYNASLDAALMQCHVLEFVELQSIWLSLHLIGHFVELIGCTKEKRETSYQKRIKSFINEEWKESSRKAGKTYFYKIRVFSMLGGN